MNRDPSHTPHDHVGLCRRCAHAEEIPHPRGGASYWRCLKAATDPRLRRYPVLPVVQCEAFEPEPPQ